MPAQTPCRYCGRVGFVRFEHVIVKRDAYRQYYCGACDRTWEIPDEPAPPPDPPDRPRKR